MIANHKLRHPNFLICAVRKAGKRQEQAGAANIGQLSIDISQLSIKAIIRQYQSTFLNYLFWILAVVHSRGPAVLIDN